MAKTDKSSDGTAPAGVTPTRKGGAGRARDAAGILEAARVCRESLGLKGASTDHADLYGDYGLPR